MPFAQRTDLTWAIVAVTRVEEVDYNILMGYSHRILTRDAPWKLQGNDGSKEPMTRPFLTHDENKGTAHTTACNRQVDLKDSGQYRIPLSVHDAKLLDIHSQGIKRTKDVHYEMPLPLRRPRPLLHDNRCTAHARLQWLTAKFTRDPDYMEKICKIHG